MVCSIRTGGAASLIIFFDFKLWFSEPDFKFRKWFSKLGFLFAIFLPKNAKNHSKIIFCFTRIPLQNQFFFARNSQNFVLGTISLHIIQSGETKRFCHRTPPVPHGRTPPMDNSKAIAAATIIERTQRMTLTRFKQNLANKILYTDQVTK